MDLPGAAGEVERGSIFDRSRHAIAHFTLVMVVLSTALALVGVRIGTRLVEEYGSGLEMAAQTSQGATLVEVEPPAGPSTVVGEVPEVETPRTPRPEGAPDPVPVVPPSTANPAPPVPSPTTVPEIDVGTTEPSTTATPPPTTPSLPTTTHGGVSAEARGQAALGRIAYPWTEKLPGWRIDFLAGRSGLFGLTLVDERRIEIYVRDDQSDELLVHIIAHEIGHAVDVTLNDGPDRRRWQGIRGIGDEPWWPDSAASDFSTGAGDFAESFAYWQVRSGNYRSKLGPAPNEAQLQLMAELAQG